MRCVPRPERPPGGPARAEVMASAGMMSHARLTANDRGVAVVLALLLAVLLGAIAAALLALTTTETSISVSFRHGQEAAHGAEAALERALHDLAAMADWSAALSAPPGNVTSTA